MKTTQQDHEFWGNHAEENIQFFRELFSTLTPDEVKELQMLHRKLMAGFDKIYTGLRG